MKKKLGKQGNSKPDSLKSRKEKRKETRKAKKLNKHQHYLKIHSKKYKQEFEKSEDDTKQTKKEKNKKNRENRITNKASLTLTDKNQNKEKKFKTIFDERDAERSQEKKQRELLNKQFKKSRIEKFKIENEEEEKVIKTLEKKLKLNRRKNKVSPFAVDGLDYLLGICDKEFAGDKSENLIYDSDHDFTSDLAVVARENKIKDTKKKLMSKASKSVDEVKVNEGDDSDDEANSEQEDNSDDEHSSEAEDLDAEENEEEEDEDQDQDEDVDEDEEDEESNESNIDSSDFSVDSDPEDVSPKKRKNLDKVEQPMKKKRRKESESEQLNYLDEEQIDEEAVKNNKVDELQEDIYGRLKDKKGNVVNAYKPPQLRNVGNNQSEKNSEKMQRLRRQLKGLLNRLAENNMSSISSQIEDLYMSNSRNDMNETLCHLFHEALISVVLTPERLITEHAMLIAILHGNVGSEVSAHFLQHMVTNLDKLWKEDLNVEDKRINNLLLFIMHLYNFRIFHSQLMYDIIDTLLEELKEKQIELILLVFKTVGFALRKDDPVALKSLVLKVQEKANTVSTDDQGSRVKFMLEMVLAIKNNNMSKIPNYHPEDAERLRKSLKVLIRKGNFTSELKISLTDLLNAEKHGRWWIVGSAWSGLAPTEHNANKTDEKPSVPNTFSQKLLDLAKKQRMNTDVRRNVFCILMSAEDYLEAFEKLVKLGLKGAVEREIMNVLVHCALQEKEFNPYYQYLANKFCTFDRKYQMMLQYAIWDKIKDLENLHSHQITNLAKFLGHVVLGKGLPISVLKVIQFAEMDKISVKFIRQVLLTIFLSNDKEAIAIIFRKIAKSDKLKVFREGLRLFLHHFVLRNVKNIPEENISLLKDMVDVADKALLATDLDFVF